jgi:uncharacterized protein (TIGR00661 family)
MARILISPLSWGLGHATRDIPIIKDLLQRGHTVGVAATGIALEALTREFPDLVFYDVPDYPSPYTSDGFSVTRVAALFPLMVKDIARERRIIGRIVKRERYDLVISDNRFGAYSKDVPSFFISHQIRFSTPGNVESVERMMEVFNGRYHRHFERVIVPDNPPGPTSLSGKLGYARRPITRRRAYWAGIITDIGRRDVVPDIDYLVSISGPKVTKEALKEAITRQIGRLSGKKVILLGDPGKAFEERPDDDTVVKSHADRHEMADLMNRARFVITRSGYTTVMELAELKKKEILFIPTPGQTEQEYLSAYYEEMGWVHSASQHNLDLVDDVARARTMRGFPPMSGSRENIARLYERVIAGYLPHPRQRVGSGAPRPGYGDGNIAPLAPPPPRK